jgi:hypothetical protein
MIDIDTSGVPKERQDLRFRELCDQLQAYWANEVWANAVCIHEAAHAFYRERMGCTNIVLNGPSIEYDREHDTFKAVSASAECDRPFDNGTFDHLFAVGVAIAAGGVAAYKLTGMLNKEEIEGDRQKFLRLCQLFSTKGQSLDGLLLWKQAQDKVSEDLDSEDPSVREGIWKWTRRAKQKLMNAK